MHRKAERKELKMKFEEQFPGLKTAAFTLEKWLERKRECEFDMFAKGSGGILPDFSAYKFVSIDEIQKSCLDKHIVRQELNLLRS